MAKNDNRQTATDGEKPDFGRTDETGHSGYGEPSIWY